MSLSERFRAWPIRGHIERFRAAPGLLDDNEEREHVSILACLLLNFFPYQIANRLRQFVLAFEVKRVAEKREGILVHLVKTRASIRRVVRLEHLHPLGSRPFVEVDRLLWHHGYPILGSQYVVYPLPGHVEFSRQCSLIFHQSLPDHESPVPGWPSWWTSGHDTCQLPSQCHPADVHESSRVELCHTNLRAL